jgi:hypothetical protein
MTCKTIIGNGRMGSVQYPILTMVKVGRNQ